MFIWSWRTQVIEHQEGEWAEELPRNQRSDLSGCLLGMPVPDDTPPRSVSSGHRLVALMNSYSEGMSGGDACFIEIAKRLSDIHIVIVTSALGARACLARSLRGEFWVTTREARFSHTILTYLIRIIRGLLLVRRLASDDVVYATSDFLPDVLPAFLARLRSPCRLWVQRAYHLIPRNRLIPHYAQRASHVLMRTLADLVIVDNDLLRQSLLRASFSPEKVAVNYPGIDVSYYASFRSHPTKEYDGVFLGRLHRSKGVFDLVDIWRMVCQSRPSARLAIIGKGSADVVAALRARVVEAGLTERVLLLGFLDTPDVVRTLERSRVFLSPSHEEGFGMVIAEALTCGLPVVSWNLPVYREVFPAGVEMVPHGQLRAFADAVLMFLQDESLSQRVAAAGQAMVRRYDWHSRVRREVELFNQYIRFPLRGATSAQVIDA